LNKQVNEKVLLFFTVVILIVGILCAIVASFAKNSSRQPESEATEETTEEPTTVEVPTDYNPALDPRYQTTEEPTTVTEEPTTEEPFDEAKLSTMFTTTNVNVRTEPNTDCEVIITLYKGKEISVYDYAGEDWSRIWYDGHLYWICSEYISTEMPVIETQPTGQPTTTQPTTTPSRTVDFGSDFHYYGIWTGKYWHFTPEQIDNQWGGYKTGKPKLATGTTRAWQAYLYQKLSERGLSWWYKYACAQAMQESGFNPLADNGIDYGLFSFRLRYWDSSYGNVYDYKANINAYVDRIAKYLVDVKNDMDIYMALSQHYLPDGNLHWEYVNAVLGRLNELWICD